LCVLTVEFLVYLLGIGHAGFSFPTSARVMAVLPLGVLLLTWHRRVRWYEAR